MTVEIRAGDAGSGDPVVLLHAFPLSSAMWAAQQRGLADRWRVVTPDLRGFGSSPLGDDEPSLDASAADVLALLDRLELDRVVLGGLSMGGYVAMAVLRQQPARVRALVLADTKPSADSGQARDNRLRIADRLDAERTSDVLLAEVLPGLVGETTRRERPETVARVTELVRACRPEAAAWAQRAMAARPDSTDTLRAFAGPALVVLGDEDRLASRSDADVMVDALPQGRLEVLAGSGHLSAMETPDAFTAAMSRFLESV